MSMERRRAITRIQVEGFRSLRSVTLEPGQITVLIGPNGAGKSNLLSFLRMVPLMHTGQLRRFVGESGGASALLHYGPKVTPELSFQLDFVQEPHENTYEVLLGYGAGDRLVFLDEQVSHRRQPDREIRTRRSLGAGHAESALREAARVDGATTERAVSWWLSGMSFFHFHDTSLTSALRTNARAEDNRTLRSDGSNLAAFLYRLKGSQDPADRAAWRRISTLVRRIAPSVQELDPQLSEHTDPSRPSCRLEWLDDRGEVFGAGHLSDGTLRAIALVTALAQPASTLPAFITIDEPELGLHPKAIALFAGLVRSVSSRCQVVLATQSPALLDHFGAEDVVVVEREDSATVLRRLEPDALGAWLSEYSLSELFDKNLLGGRP
ncbi:MAG: AAA family ATPase [Alphaproteobacteria bacterium]|nr:AAA family ATPase [Alphaproteobacteria bacterium]